MQERARPSIADDPEFAADLGSLDEGLGAPGTPAPAAHPAAPRAPDPPPATLEPPSGELPPIQITPVGRPLIDLFPTEALQPPGTPEAPPAPRPASLRQTPRADRLGAPAAATFAPARRAGVTAPDVQRLYGLVENPFTLSTDPKFIFHSVAHDRTAQALLSAIRRRDAVVVVTGEDGVGKTTTCRAVMEELDRRTLTCLIADPSLTPDELLKTVLVAFGVITRDDLAAGRLSEASRASLMAAVREFLHSLVALQAFAVVIVDDAHAMSIELLEQLRLVSDLQDDLRLLQVVLVGEPSLSVLLRRPELRALADRVTVRERLAPLDAGEVAGYVAHRLQTAADRPRVIFDGSAIAALYAYSRGTPRIVNLVADRALSIGCERAVTTIDAAIVQQAAADRFIEAPPPARRPLGRFVAAALFALLVLAGAGTAAWVFRGPLARLVTQWVRPAAPQPPMVSPPARPPASP